MDPNATLAELRAIARNYWKAEVLMPNDLGPMLNEMAERFDALDEWLSRGGFLPAAWNKNR